MTLEGVPILQPGIVSLLVGFILALLLMLFKGTIVTRREADAKDKVIEKQWETIERQGEQIALLAEVGRTVEQLARGLQREMDP